MVETMGSSTSSVLSGIVVLGECGIRSKTRYGASRVETRIVQPLLPQKRL